MPKRLNARTEVAEKGIGERGIQVVERFRKTQGVEVKRSERP